MPNSSVALVKEDPSWALSVAPDVVGMRILIANLYFIGEPNSSENWILVDAGVGPCANAIERAADERFGAGARPKAIVLTHGHFDHVGGLKELAERWNVPVYAHELELPFLTGRSDYPPPDPGVGGGAMAWLSFLYPRRAIDLGDRVQALPADGSIPFLSGWRAVHTPGHTPGHVALFREADRVLIAGDAIITTKQESMFSAVTQSPQTVQSPPAYFTIDWTEARESVQKIAALRPSIVATGHGIPMRGQEMQEQLQTLAAEFDRLGMPAHGRYVDEPALANEFGIITVPPPTVQGQLPKVALGIGVAAAGLALWSMLRRNSKRSDSRRNKF